MSFTNIPPGQTIVITAEHPDFLNLSFSHPVGNNPSQEVNLPLEQSDLSNAKTRIILDWPSVQDDLDLHAIEGDNASSTQCHVYFG